MQQIPISNSRKPVKGPSFIKKESGTEASPKETREENAPEKEKETRRLNSGSFAKFWIAGTAVVVILFLFYLVYVLYRTTVTEYDKYARAAADEQWTLMTYSASRGMIYDSNLVPLASNTYDFTVICSPKMVTSTMISREEIMQGVVSILRVPYEKIEDTYALPEGCEFTTDFIDMGDDWDDDASDDGSEEPAAEPTPEASPTPTTKPKSVFNMTKKQMNKLPVSQKAKLVGLSTSEFKLFTKLVNREAGTMMKDKIMVAAVVWNRKYCKEYPGSIKKVIRQTRFYFIIYFINEYRIFSYFILKIFKFLFKIMQ